MRGQQAVKSNVRLDTLHDVAASDIFVERQTEIKAISSLELQKIKILQQCKFEKIGILFTSIIVHKLDLIC